MEIKTKNIYAYCCAVFTVCIWGTTFISTKILLNNFSPVEIMFYRFLLAAVILFLMRPKILKCKSTGEELLFVFAGLLGIALYQLCENTALSFTYASNVSFITTLAPFFTTVFSMIFLKSEKAGIKFYLGFVIAISGVFLISFNGVSNFKLNPAGDLLAMLAAVLWGGYSVIIKKISALGYNIIQTTAKIFFYALLFIIPELFIFKSSLNLNAFLNPEIIFNILFLEVLASAVCFVTWNYSVKQLGALKTSAFIYLLPVITVITSFFILKEKITWLTALGMALTVCGLFISQFVKKIKIIKIEKEDKKTQNADLPN